MKKSAIPTSTFTEPRWALPGSPFAHRMKVDPAGFLTRVSLCGVLVPEGCRRFRSNYIRQSERCEACEVAAKEVPDA